MMTLLPTPIKSLKIWNDLVAAGAKPCGLGARDSLRLEAGLWLYGNDIDETTNPVEAGLKWVVKMKKPYFNGKKALEGIIEKGVKRVLVGLMLTERGIPRHGYEVYDGEKKIGVITSGGVAPTLDAEHRTRLPPTRVQGAWQRDSGQDQGRTS